MSFDVRWSEGAEADLSRLFDFLLDRAATVEDLVLAQRALDEVRAAAEVLAKTPYSFRKAGSNPARRELIIPFGASGYVALYEIESATLVVMLAVRHQLEADYH